MHLGIPLRRAPRAAAPRAVPGGWRWIWACAACLAAQTPAAAPDQAVPRSFEAGYDVVGRKFGLSLKGRVQANFRRAAPGARYLFQVSAGTVGLSEMLFSTELRMKSQGLLGSGGLQPLTYHYLRLGYKQDEWRLKFDWEPGVLEVWKSGAARQSGAARRNQNLLAGPGGIGPGREARESGAVQHALHLAPGDLADELVYWIRLMMDLRGSDAMFDYSSVTRKGEWRRHVFRREAEEDIETALGSMRTVRLSLETVSPDEQPKERRLRVWCAPDLDFVPVRAEFLKRGELRAWAILREHRYLD